MILQRDFTHTVQDCFELLSIFQWMKRANSTSILMYLRILVTRSIPCDHASVRVIIHETESSVTPRQTHPELNVQASRHLFYSETAW